MKRVIFVVGLLFYGIASYAFSPYENHLLTAKVKRVALIAQAKPGREQALGAALKGLNRNSTSKAFKEREISNLSTFKRKLGEKVWFMVYFDYAGRDYIKAAHSFESAGEFMQEVDKLIDPHPRAAQDGSKWLQMEWICYIRGSLNNKESIRSDAMVTTIRAEKESRYRMLHQSVWPGVINRMTRCGTRNFSIFLMEYGDKIYEFFYQEYVGEDADKDGAIMKADPVIQRWWKITDACQEALPGEKEIWAAMERVR